MSGAREAWAFLSPSTYEGEVRYSRGVQLLELARQEQARLQQQQQQQQQQHPVTRVHLTLAQA